MYSESKCGFKFFSLKWRHNELILDVKSLSWWCLKYLNKVWSGSNHGTSSLEATELYAEESCVNERGGDSKIWF